MNAETQEILKWGGNCHIEHRNAAGELLAEGDYKNLILTVGLNWLKALIGNNGASACALYVGTSNNVAAPAASGTDLLATVYTGFGLERLIGAYASTGDGVFTISKTFTNATAQHIVASVGLYFAASGASTILAGVAITSATLEVSDTLAVTWTVTITDAA